MLTAPVEIAGGVTLVCRPSVTDPVKGANKDDRPLQNVNIGGCREDL